MWYNRDASWYRIESNHWHDNRNRIEWWNQCRFTPPPFTCRRITPRMQLWRASELRTLTWFISIQSRVNTLWINIHPCHRSRPRGFPWLRTASGRGWSSKASTPSTPRCISSWLSLRYIGVCYECNQCEGVCLILSSCSSLGLRPQIASSFWWLFWQPWLLGQRQLPWYPPRWMVWEHGAQALYPKRWITNLFRWKISQVGGKHTMC